jgi:hypothetical protein
MPDAWEAARGLDPRDRLDGAAPRAGGTTNLEAYLEARSGVAAASQQTATGRQWSDQSLLP